jgi:hypothetical protein
MRTHRVTITLRVEDRFDAIDPDDLEATVEALCGYGTPMEAIMEAIARLVPEHILEDDALAVAWSVDGAPAPARIVVPGEVAL